MSEMGKNRWRLLGRWSLVVVNLVLVVLLVAVTPGVTAHLKEILAPEAGPPPDIVSYQGLVKDNGQPYTGTGYFTFSVTNTSTGDGTPYWSSNEVALTVSDGLFDVLLGDTSLEGMTALDGSVFAETATYLRVWFSTTSPVESDDALEPNQRIASVPYALRASDADALGCQGPSHYAESTDVAALSADVATLYGDVASVFEDMNELQGELADLRQRTDPRTIARMTGYLATHHVNNDSWVPVLGRTVIVDKLDSDTDLRITYTEGIQTTPDSWCDLEIRVDGNSCPGFPLWYTHSNSTSGYSTRSIAVVGYCRSLPADEYTIQVWARRSLGICSLGHGPTVLEVEEVR